MNIYMQSLIEWLSQDLRSINYNFSKKSENSVDIFYKDHCICELKQDILGNDETGIFFSVVAKKSKSKFDDLSYKILKEYWKENLENHKIYFPAIKDDYRNNQVIFVQQLENIINILFEDITVEYRINSVKFDNYRCFKDETFSFDQQATVLIGKNSSGKTSILDAVAVSISSFLSGINEKTDNKTITKDDVRFSAYELDGVRVIDHHPPTKLTFNTDFINKRYQWSRARNSLVSTKLTTKDSNKVVDLVRYLTNEIRNNKDRKITLPVFSYHGTGRVANFTKNMNSLDKTKNLSRFMGYKDCLKPASNYKFFISWYGKMQYKAFTLGKKIPVLEAVTSCLELSLQMLTEGDNFKINRVLFWEDALHIEYENGTIMPISLLSDGYQDYIGIISDIAYRMSILNPHLGEKTISETPGVVLIDEIDVHLHPKWQQKILPLLKKLFPKVQFIVTTHSPIIVSTTTEGEAIELFINEDSRIDTRKVGDPNRWYISDILSSVFDLENSPIKNNISTADKIENYSEYVNEYLVNPTDELYANIVELYSELEKDLKKNTPQYRAINSLMELIKNE